MKKALVLGSAVLFCAAAALGQVGYIQLSLSPTYLDCDYWDVSPALVQVHALHRLTPGVVSSRWMVRSGGGFNCAFLNETIEVPGHTGTTQTGLYTFYGDCLPSNILVATMYYFCMGISPGCAYLEVVADPAAASGKIEIVDCNGATHYIGGSGIIGLIMNNDGTCGLCYPPATETTTWGQVKALYR